MTNLATYKDTSDGSTLSRNQYSSSGFYACLESDQTKCQDDSGDDLKFNRDSSPSSTGHIYDLDAPGVDLAFFPKVENLISRFRANYIEFASYNGERASDTLNWFARSSICTYTDPDPNKGFYPVACSTVNKDAAGDDQSGEGTTKTSWNLQ